MPMKSDCRENGEVEEEEQVEEGVHLAGADPEIENRGFGARARENFNSHTHFVVDHTRF